MFAIVAAVAYALFTWWFATGVIFYLVGRPRASYRLSFAVATVLALAALAGLALTRHDTTPPGAYLAFSCGIVLWAWQEMSFLMGFLTGPRQQACAAGCHGWRHFVHGIEAILHHEFALLAGGLAVLLAAGGANWVGPATYGVLWLMRQSAKLNLFLGVRNLGEALLPAHLAYLKGYFRRRAMNPLLPLSVIGAAGAALWLALQALALPTDGYGTAARLLVATLLALAALEHLFLVLPVPLDALWRWSLKSRQELATAPAAVAIEVKP